MPEDDAGQGRDATCRDSVYACRRSRLYHASPSRYRVHLIFALVHHRAFKFHIPFASTETQTIFNNSGINNEIYTIKLHLLLTLYVNIDIRLC